MPKKKSNKPPIPQAVPPIPFIQRKGDGSDTTMNQLLKGYYDYCTEKYGVGVEHPELRRLQCLAPRVAELCGDVRVADFFAPQLTDLMHYLVQSPVGSPGRGHLTLSRGFVNQVLAALVRMVKWGEKNMLASDRVVRAWRSVDRLRRGTNGVREAELVPPPTDEDIEFAIQSASPLIGCMMRVLRLTGMKPGELTSMRMSEIDRSVSPWVYYPKQHKNLFRGVTRIVALTPRVQELIAPWLTDNPDDYVFRPVVGWELSQGEKRFVKRKDRKDLIDKRDRTKYNAKRSAERAANASVKEAKERYKAQNFKPCYNNYSFRLAVRVACQRAAARAKAEKRKFTPFHPQAIRRSAAVAFRNALGIEAAGVLLGNSEVVSTIHAAQVSPEMVRAAANALTAANRPNPFTPGYVPVTRAAMSSPPSPRLIPKNPARFGII